MTRSPSSPLPADRSVSSGPHRSLRVFNVGLPKTGTTSIAHLLGAYRSGHEYQFEETVAAIQAHAQGTMSDADWRQFVVQRHRASELDVDSSSFNHYYADVLVDAFDDAQFLCTVRDCYSWVESVLNMCLRYLQADAMESWLRDYANFVFETVDDPVRFESARTFLPHVPRIINGLVRHWAAATDQILALLPAGRHLVIRTPELSDALPDVADFLSIPPSSLVTQRAHCNAAPLRVNWLDHLDAEVFEAQVRAVGGPLMDRLFPGFTLDAHRAGRPYPHPPQLDASFRTCTPAPAA